MEPRGRRRPGVRVRPEPLRQYVREEGLGLTTTRVSLPTLNWIRYPDGGDDGVPAGPTWPLEDVLAAAAAAGFRDVGLDDLTVGGAEPDDVAASLRSHALECTDVGVLRIGAGEIRSQAEELARLAAATGARVCIAALVTDRADEGLPGLNAAAAILHRAGVRLALEFVAYSGLPTLADAIDLCGAVGWDRCGVLVDTWHFFREGAPWELLRTLRPERVALVHVNDAPGPPGDDIVAESRLRRVPPGAGIFGLAEFANRLRAMGYDGVVSVEVLSSTLRRRPPAEGARALAESVARVWPVRPVV